MSYGIEILSGIGTLQITTNKSISGLRVIDSGTGSTIPGTGGYTANTLVAINYTPAPGGIQKVYIDKNSSPWGVFDENNNPVAVDWVKLESFNDSFTPSSSGYGIQIFDINQELAFDSEGVGNTGASITNYGGLYEFSGDYTQDTGPLSTDITDYAYLGATFHNPAGGTFAGYVFANNYNSQYTGIYYSGFVRLVIDTGTGYPSVIESALTNLSEIFTITTGSV